MRKRVTNGGKSEDENSKNEKEKKTRSEEHISADMKDEWKED